MEKERANARSFSNRPPYYGGSGPAQLALAILLDFSSDEEVALNNYQAFKTEFIASLSQEDTQWTITGSDIAAFLHRRSVRQTPN